MVIFNLIWIQQKPKNNFSLTILNDFGELTFRYDGNVFFDEIKLPLVESDDVREMILRSIKKYPQSSALKMAGVIETRFELFLNCIKLYLKLSQLSDFFERKSRLNDASPADDCHVLD
jgi:hypothetical protein